jgi:hypothetical protein
MLWMNVIKNGMIILMNLENILKVLIKSNNEYM